MKFGFIAKHRGIWPVRWICEALGVSRALYLDGGGLLYVAVVLDLFSRRIVGWSTSTSMTAQLVADALTMALWRRGKRDALLHHSDQGSQYERAVPASVDRERRDLQH